MNAEDIKTLVSAFFERLFNQKDLDVCEVVLSPHYIDHDFPEDSPPGPSETKRVARQMLAAYPNLKVIIRDVFASENKAAAQIFWTGTHGDTREKLKRLDNIIIHVDADGYFLEKWSTNQNIETK